MPGLLPETENDIGSELVRNVLTIAVIVRSADKSTGDAFQKLRLNSPLVKSECLC